MAGKKKIFIFLILGILFIAGGGIYFAGAHWLACFASGGGSEHTPPNLSNRNPMLLELKLSRWAAPECLSGQVTDDFSEVMCHYRLKGAQTFESSDMTVVREEQNRAIYQCHIILSIPLPAEIEYYFDFKMNGVYSRRDEKPLLFK